MRGRGNGHIPQLRLDLAGEHINLGDAVDLIPKELHPHRRVAFLRRNNLQHIPSHPERPPVKIHVVSVVVDIDQFPDHLIPILLHAGPQGNNHPLIILGTAQTVNTGNTGHYDHIPPLNESGGGGQPQLVNFLIDGGVLGNIGV